MADAITGTAAPDTQQPDTTGPDDIDARIQAAVADALARARAQWSAQLNAAITNRIKATRGESQQAQPAQPTMADADSLPTTTDAATRALHSQLREMQRKLEEAEAARAAERQQARMQTTVATLTQQLAAKGITGARARAVIADWQTSRMLRASDDGTVTLAFRHSPTKGAQAEEVEYVDLAAGVDAWTKTPDAAEFMPAAPVVQPQVRRVGGATQPGTHDKANPLAGLTAADIDALIP